MTPTARKLSRISLLAVAAGILLLVVLAYRENRPVTFATENGDAIEISARLVSTSPHGQTYQSTDEGRSYYVVVREGGIWVARLP